MSVKLKNIRDSYRLYKKEFTPKVDINEYARICGEFNKFLIEKVLDGEEVTLPARMGYLSISGRKQKVRFDENGDVKGLAPDWVKTKKLWNNNQEAKERKQLIYHTNPHTNGVRYRFFWSKNNIYMMNKQLYSLRLSRANKRAIYRKIKEGKEYLIKEQYYKAE